MKTIKIDPSVLSLVPKEFLNLPDDATYRLTKTESRNQNSRVSSGTFVTGDPSVIEVKRTGLPGLRVQGQGFNYIRTSPIVKVLDSSDTVTVFETEGGVYRLERLAESK